MTPLRGALDHGVRSAPAIVILEDPADGLRRTLQGYETMPIIRRCHVEQVKRRDGKALASFVEALFGGNA